MQIWQWLYTHLYKHTNTTAKFLCGAQVYADSDAQIAAIMKREDLSEEERAKLIADVRAAAEAARRAITQEAAEQKQKDAELQAGIERYRALSKAAEEAMQRAIDSGMLVPGSQGTSIGKS